MALATVVVAGFALGGSAFAAGESHPFMLSFGRTASEAFAAPNGIAIDEATGDVYVADLGTATIDKFDASGEPVEFTALRSAELTGAATPAKAFSFPDVYGTPAAIAVDNSTSPADPSRGDIYVMDAGNGVIDKFSPSGEYLGQIAGFEPASGSAEHELLGLAVDANGTVRADVSGVTARVRFTGGLSVEEFDDSTANHLIAQQHHNEPSEHETGTPVRSGDGLAVGPTGDDYMLFNQGEGGVQCSCAAKFGQQLGSLGLIDGYRSNDVAIAADPATGHLFADDQSSIAEWDNGAVNGAKFIPNSQEYEGAGTLVSRFGEGRLSGSSEQGGIAVDGATGEVYVADPADGKVYVFGSAAPAVFADAPTSVTKESATLNATVNPRGVELSSCEIEYGVADLRGRVANELEPYEHRAACEPQAAAIGNGDSPVAISLPIEGLRAGLLYRFRIVAASAAGTSQSAGLLATQGPGFGLSRFELSFVNEDGSPDLQAGSHPYEMRNNIEFNSHYIHAESNADSMYLREPDGTPRDISVDLPPGLIGDPNATAKKCTLTRLFEERLYEKPEGGCPPESLLGRFEVNWSSNVFGYDELIDPVYNMAPPRGDAAQFGINYGVKTQIFISSSLLAGGDYPIQATLAGIPTEAPVIRSQLTLKGVLEPCVAVLSGEGAPHGKYLDKECTELAKVENGSPTGAYETEPGHRKAFLTLPTACNGPLRTTIALDSYQEPGHWVHAEALTKNLAGVPVRLSDCSKLKFPPEISVAPDSTDASTSSGLTVGVKVPQTAALNPGGLAESSLRDTTVALPAGVALNPAGADGLQSCTGDPGALGEVLGSPGDQIGYRGQEELNAEYEPGVKWSTFTPEVPDPLEPGSNFCPEGSKIGTVKIKTPLLEHELEGAVYLASQEANPFASLVAMYLVAEDPFSGSLIKVPGEVQLCGGPGEVIEGITCGAAGQIISTFKNTPDLPFEELQLHFFGGERAPLATPAQCGAYTTKAVFTPWDGNGTVTAESTFDIDHGPHGGSCPTSGLPFQPSLEAGSTSNQAGGFSPFTMTMSRTDGQQTLQAINLKMPPGLSGILTGVELCPEPQADQGQCGPNSLVGETIVSVGVGNDPFSVTGGKVYLTGPYKGAPFGLSIVNPAKAGPFDLENTADQHPACDCLVVRAKIEVDPHTAALTVTSDNEGPYKIPTVIEGIPLEIQHVNVTINRPGFTFNPTNCDQQQIGGTLDSTEGASSAVSLSFQATNCGALGFAPKFTVATSGRPSRANGESLSVKLSYPNVGGHSVLASGLANIRQVKVELPRVLPSRLSTLQKACTKAQFEANPAGCPSASVVGHARATTPLLPVSLEGPAYFVSSGNESFPKLIVVLQGYGVTIDLVGDTFISKQGITSSTFKAVPDAPVGSFELNLPTGPYSALAAIGNPCKKKLVIPTEIVAQNGAQMHQQTKIAVTGCPKHKTIKHKTIKHRRRRKHKRNGKASPR